MPKPNVYDDMTFEVRAYSDERHLHAFMIEDNCEAETEDEAEGARKEMHSHAYYDADEELQETGPAFYADDYHYHELL